MDAELKRIGIYSQRLAEQASEYSLSPKHATSLETTWFC
jgi:hypothetical protein